jgi:hypothetical protein
MTARLYEIANIPITSQNKNGDIDVQHKNAALIISLTKLPMDRKFGSTIQRQLTVMTQAPTMANPAEVEKEIKALEAEFETTRKIPASTTGKKKTKGATAVSSK